MSYEVRIANGTIKVENSPVNHARLNVYVDERDGNGWILFEDVNLEEWAALIRES